MQKRFKQIEREVQEMRENMKMLEKAYVDHSYTLRSFEKSYNSNDHRPLYSLLVSTRTQDHSSTSNKNDSGTKFHGETIQQEAYSNIWKAANDFLAAPSTRRAAPASIECRHAISLNQSRDITIAAWNQLVEYVRKSTLNLQLQLTRLQELQETISSTIVDCLKKFVVSESGYLAARQYEIQTFFLKLEAFDPLDDVAEILSSISSAQCPVLGSYASRPIWSTIHPHLDEPSMLPKPPRDYELVDNIHPELGFLTNAEIDSDVRIRCFCHADLDDLVIDPSKKIVPYRDALRGIFTL